MSLMLAAALWCFHGVILLWNWGRFRRRIALLHGLGVGVVAWALLWLGVPEWALYAAGAVVGAAGGWGHPLAPGLWPGIGLLWAAPFLLRTAPALTGAGAFALAAQGVAFLVSFTRSSL